VTGLGPVIGEGDITLGSEKERNWCNFPRSYQAGKHKKLVPKVQFSIRNYDVYQAVF